MSYYNNKTLPPIGSPLAFPPAAKDTPTIQPAFLDLFAMPSKPLPLLPELTPEADDALKKTVRPTSAKAVEKQKKAKKQGKVTATTANGRAGRKKAGVPVLQGKLKGKPKKLSDPDPFDASIIGGRFTICICMYGDYHELHRRCLGAVLATTPKERRQIRIVCNQVCNRTLQWLSKLRDEGYVYRIIANPINRKKYPAMRQLFWDKECPIEDKWIVWFDDDSIADKDATWLRKLGQLIVHTYNDGCRMFGAIRIWNFSTSQIQWIRSRPWYHGKYFQTKNGREAPNAQKVLFTVGGFWAIETAVMRQAGIPDVQIGNNGGDYMLGEQVWQAGWKLRSWNERKQFVHTSSVARRGLSEPHTGEPSWKPEVSK